jgi:aldose 1-epimerase
MRVTRAPFGTTPAGDAVEIFTLANARGLELRAMSYGGIIVALVVPDRYGRRANVVLGCDSLDAYLRDSRYLGAIVGRYANRIAHARFTLDGATYRLAANNGPHHLHGGLKGFDKVVWQATSVEEDDRAGIVLRYTSPDGEEGYPGTLEAKVTYALTDQDELIVDYRATTDRATPVNLTQHSYFNLAGAGEVFGHLLQIHADSMTPVDETLIPTGAIVPVADSRFDFRSPIAVGSRGTDYDQNFVLNRSGSGPVHAARVVEPVTGRTLDVHTTEPGLQLYTGARQALCLETQHFPDSPNQPGFPSTILRPGSEYRSRTVFTFGVSN